MVGSVTSLFTGGADEEDDDDDFKEPKTPQKVFVKRKRGRVGDDKEQPSTPAHSSFADPGKTKTNPVGADWFNSGGSKRTTVQRSVKSSHVSAEERGDDKDASRNVKKTRSKRRKRVKKRRHSEEDE